MAEVLHSAPRFAGHEGVAEAFAGTLGAMLAGVSEQYGELILTVPRDSIADALRSLRDGHEYQQLMEIAGVDYPERAERFEVVYMLLSVTKNHRIIVKCRAAEGAPVPTVTTLWPNAGWLEREVFDMFGVPFEGNTDLRRILTDYGFEGHPFRKDFPLTGYVELRYSEEEKRVVYEPVKLPQELRQFDFMSPWEGADYVLPGDEKAIEPPPAPQPRPVAEPGGKVETPVAETRGPSPAHTPKTTDTPADTGAGARTNAAAAEHVAPAEVSSGSVSGQGAGNPAPIQTGQAEPGAPEPTEDQPDRAPRKDGEGA